MGKSSFYPWGALEVRTWTPNNSQPNSHTVANPAIATGSPFEARLIWSYGEDTPFSKQTAEFELADGCRRTWRVDSFSADDIAYINAQMAASLLTASGSQLPMTFICSQSAGILGEP